MAHKINLVWLSFQMLIVLGSFLLILLAHSSLNEINASYLRETGDTWKSGPVISLELRNNVDECANDEVAVITDIWPGTVKGCDCTGRPGYPRRGACKKGKNGSEKSCRDIDETSPIPLKFWNKSLICAKRLALDYLSLELVSEGSNCPNGYKNCGVVDSLKNHLCVRTSVECPINKIEVFQTKDQINPLIYSKSIQFENGKFLAYSTNGGVSSKVSIDFKIDENTPCIYTDYYNLVNPAYVLSYNIDYSPCFPTKNGYLYDQTAVILDTESEFEFYSQNHVEDRLNSLPGFTGTDKSYVIKLFQKSYVGLTESCRKLLIENTSSTDVINNIITTSDKVDDSKYKVYATYVYNIVMLSIASLLFVLMICILMCNPDKKMETPVMGTHFILGLGCIAFNFSSTGVLSKINDHFITLANCSDDQTSDIINLMHTNIAYSYSLVRISCLFAILIFLIPGLMMITKRHLKIE